LTDLNQITSAAPEAWSGRAFLEGIAMVDRVMAADSAGGGGGGGGGGHGGGGGGDTGGGGGDLYADLYVLVRDLDPSDGGGNGEPVLDANGQVIPIGLDTATGATFPIYYAEIAEGDFEIPPDQLIYVQEVELERANMARAPADMIAAALAEALAKIAGGTSITTDLSGRIAVDGALIDSPRENLALYQFIMTAGGSDSWTDVLANADANLPPQIVDLLQSGWDPTGLLAGAFSKFTPVSMDAWYWIRCAHRRQSCCRIAVRCYWCTRVSPAPGRRWTHCARRGWMRMLLPESSFRSDRC